MKISYDLNKHTQSLDKVAIDVSYFDIGIIFKQSDRISNAQNGYHGNKWRFDGKNAKFSWVYTR